MKSKTYFKVILLALWCYGALAFSVFAAENTITDDIKARSGSNVRLDEGVVDTPYGGIGRYQNLVLQSEDFSTTWTASNATLAADSQAPNGDAAGATTLTVATASPGYVSQVVTTTVTLPYTLSVWAKSGTGTNLTLELTTNGTGATSDTGSFTLTSSWRRYSVTKSSGAGTSPTTVTARIKTTASVGQTIIIWAAQLEQVSTPGVYVKTTTTAITASKGIVSNTDLIVKGTFNPSGNLTVSGNLYVNGSGPHYFSAGNVGIGTTVPGALLEIGASASPLIFEGATADAYETIIAVTDPTTADKTITLPNATGTVAVSATSPITLSALGDIGHAVTAGNIHLPAAGASTQLLQYSSAGTAKWITMSGDASIADNGAVTIADDSHAHIYSDLDATTSANWATRVSDEVGTGYWVFNASPNFTGNVGIGTTVPGAPLQIDTASIGNGEVRINSSGTESGIGYYTSGDDWVAGAGGWSNGNDFTIGQNSGTTGVKLLIEKDTGNVGIGTTVPGKLLDVAGIASAVSLRLRTTYALDANAYIDYGGYGNTDHRFFYDAGTTTAYFDYYGKLSLRDSASSLASRIYIDNTGNVAIGTTVPTAKLDVNGTANMTTLSIGGTAVTATAAELNFVDGVTSAIQTQLGTKAPTASPTFTGSVTMPGTGIWDSSGNVGIGTATPGEKLVVEGGTIFAKQSGGATGVKIYGQGQVSEISSEGAAAIYTTKAGGSYPFTVWGNLVIQGRTDAGGVGDILFYGGSGTPSPLVTIKQSGLVGIGTTSPAMALSIVHNTALTNSAEAGLTLAHRTSGTPVTNFGVGVKFLGESDTTDDRIMGYVLTRWTDPADATRNSYMQFAIYNVATFTEFLRANLTETVVNDTGLDMNFRVEGDTNANLLFVDAGTDRVGIGTATPSYKLQVTGGSTNATAIYADGFVEDVSGKLARNLVSSNVWTVGSGSIGGFTMNGAAGENTREWGIGPHGQRAILWTGVNDAASDADGGWVFTGIPITGTKAYRLSAWIKKTGSTDGGTYLGCSQTTTNNLDGSANSNPYFWIGDLPQLNRWYLLVAYIHASDDTDTTSYGGIYDGVTGQKVISMTDFKNASGATTQTHRSLLYYDTTITDKQYFWDPRFEEVNGAEPTIEALLGLPKAATAVADAYFGANVGIGTTAPGTILPNTFSATTPKVLEIMSTATTTDSGVLIRRSDSTIGLDLWSDNSLGYVYIDSLYNSSAGDIYFRTKTAGTPINAMVISGGGNVGIGSTVPVRLLHVEGSGAGRGQISLLQSGSVATDSTAGIYWHAATTDYAIYRTSGAWTASTYQQLKLDWPTGIILDPGTGDNAGYDKSYVEITGGKGLRVTQGNVGIGTTIPSAPLDVRASSDSALAAQIGGSATPRIQFYGDAGSGVGSQINFNTGNGGSLTTGAGSGASIRISPGGSVAAHFDYWGNVGIGTTNPVSKLEVNGTIIAATPTASNHVATKAYVDAAVDTQRLTKRVFVTSTTYTGNLGGLSGADAKCQARADAVTLGGTWKAIISDNNNAANARIGYNWIRLVDMKGRVIADVSRAGSGATGYMPWYQYDTIEVKNIFVPIIYDESGTSRDGSVVWTGTLEPGSVYSNANCNNWTDGNATPYTGAYSYAATGAAYDDASWIYEGLIACNNSYRLYCIEQ